MQNFQDIEHFVKTLSAAIKKKIPTKVSQLTNDAGYKTTDTNTTYKLSKSGSTVTLTGSDGSTTSVTDSNTTYSSLKNPYSLTIQNNGTTVASYDGSTAKTANFTNATTSANGLMSKSDKAKLDDIDPSAITTNAANIKKNADAISAETTRAKAAEKANTQLTNNLKTGLTSGTVKVAKATSADSASSLGKVSTYQTGIPDNGGRRKYLLMYDITDWISAKSNASTRAFDGYFFSRRSDGYVGTNYTGNLSIVASYNGVNPDGSPIKSDNGNSLRLRTTSSTYVPRILHQKSNNKYYLSLMTGGSGRDLILFGIFQGTFIGTWINNEGANNSNGTLPSDYEEYSDGFYSIPYEKAVCDKNGKDITEYLVAAAYADGAFTFTRGNGNKTALTIPDASSSADGLMSKADKAKLDGIGTGSNVKSVNGKTGAVTLAKGDIGLGNVANIDQSKAIKSITRNGTTFTATALDGTTTTFTQQDNNTTYGLASQSSNGLMSSADKSKLDGIGAGSNVKSVNGKTGVVNLSKADVGLGNVDNTSDANKHVLANNIQWGGPNITGDISPLDVATSNLFAGNIVAYSKPAGITVEYSTDGGTTWADYGADDKSKIRLVTPEAGGVKYYLGKKNTAQVATMDLLRIELDARKMGIYCDPKKLLINISTNGGTGSYVNIEYSTRASDTVFHNFGKYDISGWSGWNSIPINNIPSGAFGTNGRDDQTVILRLTFGFTGFSKGWETKTSFSVCTMSMIASNRWNTPSSMASVNSIYRLDENQNATFPAKVTAASFSGATATSSADGLMSKADKTKLDGIGTGSNVKSVNSKTGAVTLTKSDIGLGNVDNTADSAKSVKYATSAGSANSVAWGNVSGRPSSLPANGGNSATVNGHTVNADVPSGAKFTDTTYGVATKSANGLMSAADKKKLDGVAAGADVSLIKTVKVNGTALTPDSNKAVNVTVPTLANNATTTTSGMALDARMGKTLSDQISSVKTGAIDQIVNLTAAGWTGDAAPYSQTVNVTGMTEDLLCELFSACPKSATVAEREAYNEAFALVASGYAETADGSATFLVDEKPTIDIGVRIKSISKANAISDQTSSDITSAVDAMSNTLEGRINSLSDQTSSDITSLEGRINSLSADLANIKFGVDSDGNYGYIKPGADTVTPFSNLKQGEPFNISLSIPNDYLKNHISITFPKPPKMVIAQLPGHASTHYPTWLGFVNYDNKDTTINCYLATGWNAQGSGYSCTITVYWAY